MIKRVLFLIVLPWPALAADKSKAPAEPPAVVSRVFECTKTSDSTSRLACFDREVAGLRAAQSTGDLVTMDRQQVRAARRSLFGFALPNLGVFGDNGVEASSGILETTIKHAHQDPTGKWTFDLAEGGRWVQLDNREFIVDPAAGQSIRIRRAAMGSYLANVNKQLAIRVERAR